MNQFNAAIARQSRVTATVNETIRQLLAAGKITDAEANELRRLPKMSEARARTLLGPLADSIPTPPDLKNLANPCPADPVPDDPTTTTGESQSTADIKPCGD